MLIHLSLGLHRAVEVLPSLPIFSTLVDNATDGKVLPQGFPVERESNTFRMSFDIVMENPSPITSGTYFRVVCMDLLCSKSPSEPLFGLVTQRALPPTRPNDSCDRGYRVLH